MFSGHLLTWKQARWMSCFRRRRSSPFVVPKQALLLGRRQWGVINLKIMEDVVMEQAQIMNEISSLFVRYLEVLKKCAENEDFRLQFEDNPRAILEEEVGMKIPIRAKIKLESDKRRWPAVVINSRYAEEEGKRVLEETVPKIVKDRLEIREGGLEVEKVTDYDVEEYKKDENNERKKIRARKEDNETTGYYKPQEVEVESGKSWEDSEVEVIIPYFDVEKELYAKIKIENEEIVLTAAC